jgi:hypothetical protein
LKVDFDDFDNLNLSTQFELLAGRIKNYSKDGRTKGGAGAVGLQPPHKTKLKKKQIL